MSRVGSLACARTLPSGVCPAGLWGEGLWAVPEVESSAHVCNSPSGVYPARGLQWRFACGFDFGNDL